jgi:hypothetical protein
MNKIRMLVVGAAAATTIAGVGIASAVGTVQAPSVGRANGTAQVLQQLNAAEQQASAVGNVQAVTALRQARAAVLAHQGAGEAPKAKPSSAPPPCPSPAPNAGRPQACGKDHNGTPTPSPSTSASSSPSSSASASPSTGGACGVQSEGGTAAEGPVSSILYGVGVGLSDADLAEVGDTVQLVACAIWENLTL